MLVTSWLRLFANRLAFFRRYRGKRRATSLKGGNPRASHARLTFERLEERMLLATVTVNSVLDNTTADDFLTLREAKTIVNDGNIADGITELGGRMLTVAEAAQISTLVDPLGTNDTIDFDASLNGTPILLNGEMDLFRSVTIRGHGAANTILDGQSLGRIFDISGSNVDVTLDGLTLQNGLVSDGGGAVRSTADTASRLTIQNSLVTGNSAAGGHGGAVLSQDGDVFVVNSTFSGNSTTGYLGDGGAIYVSDGALRIAGSTFSGNSTSGQFADGGAIASFATANGVTITNSTISGNTASHPSTRGGGVFSIYGAVTVVNSTIVGNSAFVGGGIGWYAAVVNPQSVTIHNSIVADNTDGTGNPNLFALGTLNVSHSLIGHNAAASGTMLTEDQDGDANGNFIGGSIGGAIDPELAALAFNGGPTQTHALLATSLAVDSGLNSLAVDHTAAALTNDQRGSPFVRIFNDDVDMGAYERQSADGFALVVDNATDENDGDYSDGDRSLREMVYLANSFVGADTITFAASLDDVPQLLNGDMFGHGGIVITESVTITGNGALNTIIDGNGGSATAFTRIFNISGTDVDVTLDGLTLQNGLTTAFGENGAAIRSTAGVGSLLDIRNSTLSGNSTASSNAYGGAIYTLDGTATITNSTLSGNSAASGGAIYSAFGAVNVIGSTLSGNSATEYAGAIWSDEGAVNVTSSTLSGNSAGSDGGAIHSRDGTVTVTSSTLSGNTSGDDGGAIYGSRARIIVVNSTLSGNRAEGGDGGALYTEYAEIRVANSTITQNYAYYYGGGVSGSNVTIVNSIVAGNTTDYDNPDIVFGSSLTVSYSLIGDNSGTDLTANPDASAANDDTTGPATHTRSFIGTGNFSAEQIGLAPLAFNGGPTMTHALLSTSLALNSGRDDLALDADDNPLVNDQRGAPFLRFAGTVDMGAYERQTVAGLTLVVDNATDENDGDYSAGDLSLREAVGLANGNVGLDTITFATSLNGVTQLLNGDLFGADGIVITESVTITGNGAANTIIDGNGGSLTAFTRIFDIPGDEDEGVGVNVDVTLDGLTLQNGRTTANFEDGVGGAIRSFADSASTLTIQNSTLRYNSTAGAYGATGGAIYSQNGNVTISRSTLSGNSTGSDSAQYAHGGAIFAHFGNVRVTESTLSENSASGYTSYGGAIYAEHGDVTVISSTLSQNSSGGVGGAIRKDEEGAVLLINSTLSGNTAGTNGGAIYAGGSDITLINSTIVNNFAQNLYGGIATFSSAGSLSIYNSIIARNGTPFEASDLSITPVVLEHSFIGSNFGTSLTETGLAAPDLNGNYIGGDANSGTTIDPELEALADNGGPTFTHALRAGSKALDSGDNDFAQFPGDDGIPGTSDPNETALAFDQRGTGFARVFNDIVDMGAYEEQPTGGFDFGDLPDTYGTLLASDGARHTATGPMLGTTRDTEADGQPNATATGDGADEDGLTADGPFIVGQTTTAHLFVTGGPGFVNAWVDLDRSGTFEATEQFLTNHAVVAGNNDIAFAIPSSLTPGEFASRFRLTSASVATPTPDGLLPDGEVEDYLGTIFAADFGDLPDTYGTTRANNGAQHLATGPTLGATRDGEADGQPNSAATGDGTDEDGLSASGPLVAGTPTNLTINSSGPGYVNAWADLNRDGDFSDPGEHVFNNLPVAAGNNVVPLLLPANFLPGDIATRFRLTSASVATPTPGGLLPDGEVEDYLGVTTNPYLTIDGNTWNFHGTAGNDIVTVDLPNGLVTINGIAFTLLPNVEHITVDGNGGFDRVSLIGTAAAEHVELRNGAMTLLPNAGGITVDTQEVEGNTFTGNAADSATFFGGAGRDQFSGKHTQSRMLGAGYDNVAVGCGTVVAESDAAGGDVAYLFDTAADNLFTANQDTASISGTGVTANGFDAVVGYATAGTDRAVLEGTAAKENLVGDRALLRFSREGLELAASAFEHVTVRSGGGGDVARLDGVNTGIDRFTGTAATSSLVGTGYQIHAAGFSSVIADALGGLADVAVLVGSPGNDRFVGRLNSAQLSLGTTPPASYEALGFDTVTVQGLAGSNRRIITPPLQYSLNMTGVWR